MESFSLFNKHTTFTQSRGDFQEYFPQSNHNLPQNPKIHQISTYQEKAQFFRYASSLLEIGTEEEQKNQHMHVYQESELFNPPQSLILKYQTMRKQRPSFDNISCESFKQNNLPIRIIEKGLTKLAVFLQTLSHKYPSLIPSKLPSSLIDILALSSVQNLTPFDQKNSLKEPFLKIKSFYHQSFDKQKTLKPSIPIDKKKNFQLNPKQNNFSAKPLTIPTKQGTEQLVGTLTFKILVLESECFRNFKLHFFNFKFQKLIHPIKKILLRRAFVSIKDFIVLSPSISNSKILTLSKSKSKLSHSKLQIHPSFSGKKQNLTKYNSQEDGELTAGEERINERVISSEILQDFDFTQFNSKINGDDIDSSDRGIKFTNRMKKKNTKQSNSQAQTVNSKRSFQSEYQFAQGVHSKVFTSRKPISVKNFSPQYADYDKDLEEIPTQKFIRKRSPQQKLQFEKNLFPDKINLAKQVHIFVKQQRRYLNVRTNLFQLPLQTPVTFKEDRLKKNTNKEQMQIIYHMLPDGLIRNEQSDQKDSLIMNISLKTLNNGVIKNQMTQKDEKKEDICKDLTEREDKKKKQKDTKDLAKMQKYYFELGIVKNNQNINSQRIQKNSKNAKNNQQKITERIENKHLSTSPSYSHQISQNLQVDSSPRPQKLVKQNQKRPAKLKIKKNDNFQEYYFKAEIKKSHRQNPQIPETQRQDSLKSQMIGPMNLKHYNTSNFAQTNPATTSKDFYEAEYKTSKLISQVSSPKNLKSLSPSVKFSLQSFHRTRTGKLGSKLIQQNPVNSHVQNNVFMSPQNKNGIVIHKTPSKMFAVASDNRLRTINQLPIEPNSSGMNTPKNVHQILPGSNPSIIFQNRSKSKLKVFSQTQRSQSPQPNVNFMVQQWPSAQGSDRKGSFITNNTHQKVIPLNRPPSNNFFTQTEHSLFTPTNSNLSNQSGFTNNIHKVINYGPNIGFSHEMNNRQSSILSTHINQSKYKIVASRSSQQLLSPTQRQFHMMISHPVMMVQNTNLSPRMVGIQQSPQIHSQSPQINRQNPQIHSQSPQAHHHQLMTGNNLGRGLNVMVSGDQMVIQRPSPNTSGVKMNQVIRPKSISNQKIFLAMRK